ncbi:MAG TPA: PPC domain-containing protein [Pyrinomonadaceae bacterium]|nr:PPC domain-containing protein [Pyrinomonadaceae bacterium]
MRALILFFMLIGVAVAQTAPSALQTGNPIERTITAGQTHTYTVSADENNFVQVAVEQRGVDVIVTVFSPAGKSLGDYDSPTGDEGSENVSFVATSKGAYRIDVTPLNREGSSGRYQIKLVELRDATEEELKASKNLATIKARALELLDEVDAIIAELRTPQTRIRSQMQAANLLWDSDEKRAVKYASDAIVGFKELRASLDADVKEYFRSYGEIAQLRYEIAYMLASRQPEMALSFVRSTPPLPDPYGNLREVSNQQTALEVEIANQIAVRDPKRALEVARETLKSAYAPSLIGTIENLRQQKFEMAAQLAGEIADKLLSEKRLLKDAEAMNLALSLIRLSGVSRRTQTSDSNDQPRRLLSEQQQRDLIQKVSNEAMAFRPSAGNNYSQEQNQAVNALRSLEMMGPEVDGVVSGGTAALQKRANELGNAGDARAFENLKLHNAIVNLPPDEALAAIQRAPKEMQESLYMQLANRLTMAGETARAKQLLTDHISNPYQRQQAITQIEQQDTYRAIAKGKFEDAIRNVANLPTPEERASMLIQIINQIGPGLKRATALNYLEQARGLLAPSERAQGQTQMSALFQIAKAFSAYDVKRAFEIVDPLVDQINDIADAARLLEGFGGEFYDHDELNMNNGNAVGAAAVQMTSTLGSLALVNFDRAKLTADRIRLAEVRIRAYLEIAQQAVKAAP